MPRSARQRSNSRVYHIMFRGNELRDIFIDDEDRNKFSPHLKKRCAGNNVPVVILKTRNQQIPDVTKSIIGGRGVC